MNVFKRYKLYKLKPESLPYDSISETVKEKLEDGTEIDMPNHNQGFYFGEPDKSADGLETGLVWLMNKNRIVTKSYWDKPVQLSVSDIEEEVPFLPVSDVEGEMP